MSNSENRQYDYKGLVINGFLAWAIIVLVGLICAAAIVSESIALIIPAVIGGLIAVLSTNGFMMLEPNQAMVMIFFGKYKGTVQRTGYFWVNPFMTKKKKSLRINNLDVEPIKVNDKVGNPILIGLVLVWRIKDTYRVVFDLDTSGGQSVVRFVAVQSDAALREVAGRYPYDDEHGHGESQLTLRSGGEEINEELERKLNERLAMAGIEVLEARINYLAYAPEIAAVMLRRQQASAIITAREKIVEGAVSMVSMALSRLEDENIVKLSDDHKATMVGNLMVVLCADEAATPVLNTGAN